MPPPTGPQVARAPRLSTRPSSSTKTTAWVHFHEIKQDVMLKIADIVAAQEAEIAFPTRTLHVVGDAASAEARALLPQRMAMAGAR